MTQVQKYRAYILLVLACSIYILSTEGWDRWCKVSQDWNSLGEKTSKVLSPEESEKRKLELRSELTTLRASLKVSSSGYDQSEAGLVELIGESATKQQIRIEALTPTKLEGGGGVALTIELLGSYHRIGSFLNNLENSPIALRLEKLEISREKVRILYAKMTLKATFARLSEQK